MELEEIEQLLLDAGYDVYSTVEEFPPVFEIYLNGELFLYKRVGEDVLISHPVWSLCALKPTLEQAIAELQEVCKELVDILHDEDTLNDQALALRAFALKAMKGIDHAYSE